MSQIELLSKHWRHAADWLRRLPSGQSSPFRIPDMGGIDHELGMPCSIPQIDALASPKLADRNPGLNTLSWDQLVALQYELHVNRSDPTVSRWFEQLLRSCELRRTELRRRCRLAGESRSLARDKLLLLCLVFLEHFQVHQDPRFVNIVLKILDQPWLRANLQQLHLKHESTEAGWRNVLVVLIWALLEYSLRTIANPNWKTSVRFSADSRLFDEPQLPMKPVFDGSSAPRVVVFCPSRYSLYTLTVLHLLKLHGVRIGGVAVRGLFSPTRFVGEFRRDGQRLFKKVWNKLVLGKRAYVRRPYLTLPDYMKELGIPVSDVIRWAGNNQVPVWRCRALNDANVLQQLKQARPNAVVFTGGGLVRDEILQASGAGIINTHLGLLPRYRGMDVVEWPALEGYPEKIGLSAHLMVRGLDEGDILAMYLAPREDTANLVQLRERMEVLTTRTAVSATIGLLHGDVMPHPQVIGDGRQYFIMHRRLYDIALKRYQRLRNLEGHGVNGLSQSDNSFAAKNSPSAESVRDLGNAISSTKTS